MYGNWHPVHNSDAYSWLLLGVLSLLWELWWKDVPKAEFLHSLCQKNSLLECIHYHGHYPVSVYACALIYIFEQHNDVLGEKEDMCLTAFVHLPWMNIMVTRKHLKTHLIVSVSVCFCVCVCVCACVHSAGNICMFRSNEALKVSLDQSTMQLNTTIDNVHTYVAAVTQVRENLLSAYKSKT